MILLAALQQFFEGSREAGDNVGRGDGVFAEFFRGQVACPPVEPGGAAGGEKRIKPLGKKRAEYAAEHIPAAAFGECR